MLAAIQSLGAQVDQVYEGANALDIKEASVLSKYLIAGMRLLTQKDAKAANMVNY